MLFNRFFAVLVLCFAVFLMACSSVDPKIEKMAEETAVHFCICAEDGAEVMEKIKNTDDVELLQKLADESIEVYTKMSECMESSINTKEYEDFMKDLSEEKAYVYTKAYNKILISNCPEIAKAYDIN